MGPIMSFMLVPCGAAIFIGWIARHWALAAAAFTGGVGGFLVLAPLASPVSVFLIPLTTGLAVAGLALIPALVWRPTISVWSRMSFALVVTFLIHFLYLSYAMAGR